MTADDGPSIQPGMSAAVLTGGQSTRMGQDKALLRVGDETLLERIIGQLRRVADDVLVVGYRPEYLDKGAVVVADRYPGAGTLGGIATALSRASSDRVLVVGCDMPLLSIPLLSAMARLSSDADAIVPVRERPNDRQGLARTYEPLHAIYSKRCLPVIERQIELGDIRAIGFLRDVRVHELDEPWLRNWDPELLALTNANTPTEFERALRRIDDEQRLEDRRG